MLRWLKGLLSAVEPWDPEDATLDQLRSDLGKDPAEFPLQDLWPVLMPSPIFDTGQWMGPYHHFAELPVSLTWAFLRPRQTMVYLSDSAAQTLERDGLDWRGTARRTLAEAFERHPWTHEFHNEGGGLEGVAMLHEDGLGPSRLLCHGALGRRFPEGFSFYVPERSSALVLCAAAGDRVRAEVERAVQGCFEAASVPMSAEPFAVDLLAAALERAGEEGGW